MQKNSITNKITPCCSLPFGVVYWWVSNLNLNTEADRQFIISKISQSGTISIDAWKVLINSGELESDASLTKAEFLSWFDCDRQPSCSQLKLIIEGFKLGNYNPLDEYGVGWTEISNYETYNDKIIRKITGYVGGVGDLPDELELNIGKYYAASGGLTTDKSLATDFKPVGALFSEDLFNQEAQKFKSFTLLSRDLATVSLPNAIPSGAGDSIFTYRLTADKKIGKFRVKVANSGTGIFTFKRSGVLTNIISVSLVSGWNTILVDFNGQNGDYIGYSTKYSTANLYFADNTGGVYYDVSGGTHDGNIAMEVYEVSYIGLNTFKDLVVKKPSENAKLNTSEFKRLNMISTPQLRSNDFGVISYFENISKADFLGNNAISTTSNVEGNFKVFDSKYIYSFAFDVTFGAMYTGTKNIASIDIGNATLTIVAGGVGISATYSGTPNGFAFDYSNKKVSFVVVADAYFTYVYVNGQKIGFISVNKKLTKFNFTINQDNGQQIGKIAFFNRRLSYKRIINWGIYGNPFSLDDAMDKLFPQEGYQISNDLIKNNKWFDFLAEQNIVKVKDKFHLYGSVIRSTPSAFIESGIGLFISNRIDGGYSMYTNDAVIGGMRNKAGVTRAMSSWAGVKDDFIYIFAGMDYTAANAGGKIFKSPITDGKTFTQVGSIVSGISNLANMGFCTEKQSNGYYYGVIEGMLSGIWQIYLVRSLNWESGWQVVQVLTSLQIQNTDRMFGGPKIMRSANDDRWIIIYHASHEMGGNVPTSLYVAECFETEPINWTNKRALLEITDELDFYNAYKCDQVATPQLIEEGGKTYISYVLAQNVPDLHCQVRIAKFDGNKEELFGLVPMYEDSIHYENIPSFTKIIASGTSITNGVGSDNGSGVTEARTWRSILQSNISSNSKTITVVNGGVNGQNTTSMRANLAALLSGNTGQVVIIEGAINDAQTAGVGIPTATTIDNLKAMVADVIASGNTPILTTPIPFDLSVSAIAAAYTSQKRIDLVNAVKKVAYEKNVKLIDFDKLFNNDLSLLVDGLHPNQKGYALMAYLLTREILK